MRVVLYGLATILVGWASWYLLTLETKAAKHRAWRLDYERRRWAEGINDQVCWDWDVMKKDHDG